VDGEEDDSEDEMIEGRGRQAAITEGDRKCKQWILFLCSDERKLERAKISF